MSRTSEPSTAGPSAGATPLFPLSTVLFPGGPLPLRIFEKRYLDMVRYCTGRQSAFGVVLIRAGSEVGVAGIEICEIGTSARIIDFNPLPDGLLGISCLGERRFRVLKHWQQDDGLYMGELEYAAAQAATPLPSEFQHLADLLRKVLPELGDLYANVPRHFDDARWVGCRLAEILPLSAAEKQHCLELDDPLARLARLSPWIRRVPE